MHLITFTLAALTAIPALAAPLKSPWDTPITPTNISYECPALMHLSPDIDANSPYKKGDPTHSIIDPEAQARNQRLVEPFYTVKKHVTEAADAFLSTGSREAAQCAITQITTMATENSMNGTVPPGQPVYVQGWIGGASAIAWLKVHQLATPDQEKLVAKWFAYMSRHQRDYYDPRGAKNDGQNNHSYWAGFDVAAMGIASQSRLDFEWGIRYYDRGTAAIQPDGTLPLELDRAARAQGYHFFALSPLIMLAELGEANGLQMYSRNNGSIHRLAALCVASWNDPSIFEKKTGKQQERKDHLTASEVAWIIPYLHRFPNHPEMQKLLAQVKHPAFDTIGGMPPN